MLVEVKHAQLQTLIASVPSEAEVSFDFTAAAVVKVYLIVAQVCTPARY